MLLQGLVFRQGVLWNSILAEQPTSADLLLEEGKGQKGRTEAEAESLSWQIELLWALVGC